MTTQWPADPRDDRAAAGPLTDPASPARRRSTRTTSALLVLGAVVLVAYVVGFLVSGNRLPRNAQISGVDVGGLDRPSAITKLERELTPRAEQPITVLVAGGKDRVSPAAAGLAVDIPASVDRAGAVRSLDPR
ncbi:MAG TPA: hypothetical protein VF635_12405, partial [Propionibacteriaceae bacterium]